MQSRQLLISFLMLFSICSYGQQWGNIGVSPEASSGQAITVRGFEDSLRLKMLNVCTSTLFVGMTDSNGMGYVVAAPFNPYDPELQLLDTLIHGSISGLAGEYGYVYPVAISTSDTVQRFYYQYNWNAPPTKLGGVKRAFDSIETIFGMGYRDWVLVNGGDSLTLFRIDYQTNGITILDTFFLSMRSFTGLYGGNRDAEDFYLLGMSASDSYVLYHINYYSSQVSHVVFDSLPGNPVYGSFLHDRAIVLSHDSVGIYTTYYHFSNDSLVHDTLVGVAGADILDLAEWEPWSNTIALLVKARDTSRPELQAQILVYELDPLSLLDTLEVEVNATRLYTALQNLYQFRYLQFTDSMQNEMLALFETDPGNLPSPPIPLHGKPDVVRPVSVCFIGIEDSEVPAIETRVFPNPTRDQCHAEIKNVPCDRDHYLELFDMNGRKVYEATFQSKCTVTIPVNGLQAGVYLLKMEIAGRSYTHKIVKQ